MALTIDDIRYRARCAKKGCNAHLGDWALQLPEEKRLCFDHKKHTVKDIEKRFGTKRVAEGQ